MCNDCDVGYGCWTCLCTQPSSDMHLMETDWDHRDVRCLFQWPLENVCNFLPLHCCQVGTAIPLHLILLWFILTVMQFKLFLWVPLPVSSSFEYCGSVWRVTTAWETPPCAWLALTIISSDHLHLSAFLCISQAALVIWTASLLRGIRYWSAVLENDGGVKVGRRERQWTNRPPVAVNGRKCSTFLPL